VHSGYTHYWPEEEVADAARRSTEWVVRPVNRKMEPMYIYGFMWRQHLYFPNNPYIVIKTAYIKFHQSSFTRKKRTKMEKKGFSETFEPKTFTS
jgi:hypothetical protein